MIVTMSLHLLALDGIVTVVLISLSCVARFFVLCLDMWLWLHVSVCGQTVVCAPSGSSEVCEPSGSSESLRARLEYEHTLA